MDDEKRTMLVAALSAYAELLAKNTEQLELEQGKGKGKAFDDDVDLKAEVQNQIKICGELSNQITDATSSRDIARTLELVCPEPQEGFGNTPKKWHTKNKSETWNNWENNTSQNSYDPTTASTQPTTLSSAKSRQSYMVEDEPYINPFTGLHVITETGYEAGPSDRLLPGPPPLLNPPKPPSLTSRPLPMLPGLSSEPPAWPAPKSVHLQECPIIPSQPTRTRSATLPPQIPAPPPPPSAQSTLNRSMTVPPRRPVPLLSAIEPQKLQQTLTTSAPEEYGLIHMSNRLEGGAATAHRAGSFTSNKFSDITSPANAQAPISSSSPLDSEAEIQNVREGGSRYEDKVKNSTPKNRYLRCITELASKAFKATGNMRSTTRTPSGYQSMSLNTRDMDNMPVEPPGSVREGELAPKSQGREQESLPRAYDIPSYISRKPSLASSSSVTGSRRSGTLSSAFSSRTSLFSTSTNTSSNPGLQQDSTQSSRRASYTGSNSKLRKSSSQISTPPDVNSLQRSMSSSALPNVTQRVKEQSSWTPSAMALSKEGHLGRRQTTSTASSRRAESDNFADDQVIVDAILARDLSLDDSQSSVWKQLRKPLPKSSAVRHARPQRISYDQKLSSTPNPPLSPPPTGSNNPWRDHMADDHAFARSLQLEEEQELQMERDMLLAYKVANGTADDGDRELAYFMSRNVASLIDSTNAVPESSAQASYDLWGMDSEALKVQIDWLEAHELGKDLRGQSSADEASFLEAKRLQEQFDQETKNDEAWEEWKGGNVGTCTSCMEEHAQEELLKECDHGYCNGCLQDGFKAALDSRAPFRCCKKALRIEDCMGLSTDFVIKYEEMMLELSTPNPMFCCNVQCAKFLPPRAIVGDIGTCEKCSTETCRHCRRLPHPGTFCAEDKETKAVKELAKAKGWKTCPGCNHLIERWVGCLHMICSRCQTAFCYRCSKPWKDCESTCPDAISATHPKI
ncbi:hypothetical protein B0J14DRAFT_638530 [Halenospora varia]|nr:hypothetical protein B0J14DRAFT_638530 [Halenospora varia]